MKKRKSFFVPGFILMAGIAVFFYPTAANYVNTRIMLDEIQSFEMQLDIGQKEGDLDFWLESVLTMAESNARVPLSSMISSVTDIGERQENSSAHIGDTSDIPGSTPSPSETSFVLDQDQILQSASSVMESEPTAVIDLPDENATSEAGTGDFPYVTPQTDYAAEAAVSSKEYHMLTSNEDSITVEDEHQSNRGENEDEPILIQAYPAPIQSESAAANTGITGAPSNISKVWSSMNTEEPSYQQISDSKNTTRTPGELTITLNGIITQYRAGVFDTEQLHRRIEIAILRYCILESISIAEMDESKYAAFLTDTRTLLLELDEDQNLNLEEMFIRLEKAALINGNRYDTNMAYGTEAVENDMDSVWSSVVNRVRMWRICLFGTRSILEELLADIQHYNERLYSTGQTDLRDPFSYSQASFNLSTYGLSQNIIGYLTIPKMNIELPVYLGANKENMSKGAAHLTQTSIPVGGINTNAVIAAHRGMSTAAMFRNIEKLQIGDLVYITNYWEKLTYRVCEIVIINPNDVESVLIQEGRDMITLLTCHPYGQNYKRYVVYCERAEPITLIDEEDTSNTSGDHVHE